MSHWDGIRAAIDETRTLKRAVAMHCDTMASLVLDNLELINGHWLAQIKIKLRRFNAKTKRWDR